MKFVNNPSQPQKTSVLETRNSDQRWLKLGQTLDNRGQGVRI